MSKNMHLQIEEYHQLFHDYLLKKFEGNEEEVTLYVETAERILPQTLNDYFGTKYESIYELQDGSEIENLRKKIKTEPVLKDIDKGEEPRYTDVLKWYRLFIKSQSHQDGPVAVPGEYQTENESTEVVADGPNSPVIHNDADYGPDTEGVEHQMNLTKKERNPKLRKKCIDYYKSLWGGRIHCICCGFDFGKAYGDIGEDYIEVHHVNPHYAQEGEHMVDPVSELIPLCSNCHSMIHRVPGLGACMTLKELKDHYKGIKYE